MADDFTSSLGNDLQNNEGNNNQNYEVGTSTGKSYISDYSNRLFGAPFQLLDSVDKRFPEINANLGNEYLRNFILNSPILHIRPGMPKYTGDQDSTSLTSIIKNAYAASQYKTKTGDETAPGGFETALRGFVNGILFGNGKKLQGRMFGFRETYYSYIQYVNYMCRSVATYMSLTEGTEFPNGCYVSGNVWKTFDKIDWQDYRMMNDTNETKNSNHLGQLSGYMDVLGKNIVGSAATIASVIDQGLLQDVPEEYKDAIEYGSMASIYDQITSKLSSVEFMVEPVSFTETLTNGTSTSFIESAIDSVQQGVGTELAWITNSNADVGIIDNLVGILGDSIESVSQAVGQMVQGVTGSFTRNLFSGAIGALKGQKMIYPKIYKDSTSSMDYQFTVTLSTPYGDPYNYYMNIVVPLLHLIALVAPRMVTSNTTTSPFIVQAYIPGMCTCQMGIISNMTITKNPTQKHVSVNGFPLTVKVTFTIEELYNAMAISPADDPVSFLHNETLNDYLCNMAGLVPSMDTYVRQRSIMFQQENRFFDQGLLFQDWASGAVEFTEDLFKVY